MFFSGNDEDATRQRMVQESGIVVESVICLSSQESSSEAERTAV